MSIHFPQPRLGNIGEPVRRIEFEPLTAPAPIETDAPERELVPA